MDILCKGQLTLKTLTHYEVAQNRKFHVNRNDESDYRSACISNHSSQKFCHLNSKIRLSGCTDWPGPSLLQNSNKKVILYYLITIINIVDILMYKIHIMHKVGKRTLCHYVNREGPDEHSHLCSLIWTFSVHRHILQYPLIL